MDEDTETDEEGIRRQLLLHGSAIGGSALLAGCPSPIPDDGSAEESTATRAVADPELAAGDETTVILSVDVPDQGTLDVFERFDTELGTASLETARIDSQGLLAPVEDLLGEDREVPMSGDEERMTPSFEHFSEGGGIILFDAVSPGSITIEYVLEVATDAEPGEYSFEPNALAIDDQMVPIEGIGQVVVER
jgi:hypothetical protein